MLPATQEEIDHVTEYMVSQAPDLKVQFVQKMYSENVLHVRHDVWDVHTDVDRWWSYFHVRNSRMLRAAVHLNR